MNRLTSFEKTIINTITILTHFLLNFAHLCLYKLRMPIFKIKNADKLSADINI